MMAPPGEKWEHDALQADLAESRIGIGEVVCQKLSLGFWGGGGEMDVFSMRLSRTSPRPTCFEIKVTRADFMQDVRSGKYQRYEQWCERGYFAAPAGLISKKEIPKGWGLMLRGENGWYSVKQSRMGPISDEQWKHLFLAVVLRMFPGPWAGPIGDGSGWRKESLALRLVGALSTCAALLKQLQEAEGYIDGAIVDPVNALALCQAYRDAYPPDAREHPEGA